MIDLKCCSHSSYRLLHKSVPRIFLIMSYSAFMVILWQILKSHFERKQSKRDYPKNIGKEEKCINGFFLCVCGRGVLVICISVTKNYRKPQMVGAGARKVEKLVRFFVQFWPLFSQYSKSTKKGQNIYSKYCNILQNYWKYRKHGRNNTWKQRITLSFCLKGTLRPNNSVQVYDSVEWQKHLILMSQGRKAKLPKLLKVS